MIRRSGPRNWPRLNALIAAEHAGAYKDWYDLTDKFVKAGKTYQDICNEFARLGVRIHPGTLWRWIKIRERLDAHAQRQEDAA